MSCHYFNRYTPSGSNTGRLMGAPNLGSRVKIDKRRYFGLAIRKIWEWA
ncbi:hypothetical protein FBY05_112136 [Pseudomonas sp. SJZ083]|nr:hypothetical protein FBY05_112136 [Pseudomonas sp. SJZ083]TWC46075.1 hypothetical protein FBY01_112136 [Pseudomonas sp. SJZ077]